MRWRQINKLKIFGLQKDVETGPIILIPPVGGVARQRFDVPNLA